MNFSLIIVASTIALAAGQTKGVFLKAVGPCIDDKCPEGNSCYYGQCIPKGIAPPMPTPDKATAVGKCKHGGMCGNDEYCFQSDCYPHPNLDD